MEQIFLKIYSCRLGSFLAEQCRTVPWIDLNSDCKGSDSVAICLILGFNISNIFFHQGCEWNIHQLLNIFCLIFWFTLKLRKKWSSLHDSHCMTHIRKRLVFKMMHTMSSYTMLIIVNLSMRQQKNTQHKTCLLKLASQYLNVYMINCFWPLVFSFDYFPIFIWGFNQLLYIL